MRRMIKYAIGLIVLAIIGFLGQFTYKSYLFKKEIEEQVQTLQHCGFRSLTGEEVFLDEFDPAQPTVIIYFHPECEHCQYEAREIGFNADKFKGTNLLMVTPDDSIKRLEDFVLKNNLTELNNFDLLLDKNYAFKKYFGTAIIPSVFIYKNHKLLKKYSGETKIDAILNVINEH